MVSGSACFGLQNEPEGFDLCNCDPSRPPSLLKKEEEEEEKASMYTVQMTHK